MNVQEFDRPFVQSLKEWLLAARPKTLAAAVIPILVGTSFAHGTVSIDWSIAIFALLALIFVQIGMNITNDALDVRKGADTRARIGPIRITQRGLLSGNLTSRQVLAIGFSCFFLALLFGIPLVVKGGFLIFIILIIAIAFGYLYTGGPFPLAYTGLADLFLLVFYGWVGTAVSYYLQVGEIHNFIFLAGTQVGLLVMIMLAVNNLRDRPQDAKVSKKTLAVRFGDRFVRIEITILCTMPFFINLTWFVLDKPLAAMLPFTAFPMAIKLVKELWQNDSTPRYNQLFALGSLLTFSFGFLLSIGALLS